jgi:ADP-dependent phosphofructokinase/glucokinase
VPFSKPYFQWIEQNARKVSSNVLSSFNALLDPELLKERLGYTKQHIEKYRKNNPEGIVFFEDAHFHSIDVKKLCLEIVGESVDILSMNEEELNHTLNEMYHLGVHVDDILSCVEGAKSIRSMFGVRRGVIIHTKDYSMYVGEPLKADIEKGLIYGNLLATAKAKHGWYGTKEQIKEVLEFGFSDRGVKNFQAVQESKYAGEAVLVPSKYIDKPRYTIGLGDSFVGGVQMCF